MLEDISWASAPLTRIKAADEFHCQTVCKTIPVVDLSHEDIEAASALRDACERYGFFYGASSRLSFP